MKIRVLGVVGILGLFIAMSAQAMQSREKAGSGEVHHPASHTADDGDSYSLADFLGAACEEGHDIMEGARAAVNCAVCGLELVAEETTAIVLGTPAAAIGCLERLLCHNCSGRNAAGDGSHKSN
jgi:hypothetical protein